MQVVMQVKKELPSNGSSTGSYPHNGKGLLAVQWAGKYQMPAMEMMFSSCGSAPSLSLAQGSRIQGLGVSGSRGLEGLRY